MQGEYPSLNVSIEALLQFQQGVGISGPMSCLRGGYLWYQSMGGYVWGAGMSIAVDTPGQWLFQQS